MKLSSSMNGKKYLTSCWRQSCIMFSRRTRWSQHLQRMGTRYTSRCRGANNLDQFAWLMGDSPYYKFAPRTSSPSLRWTYHIKWGDRFCLFRRKRLSFSGSSVFRNWVRELFLIFFLLFSCALVPEGTCKTWEAPSKGSVPRQIATCERYMRVQKTTLR